MTVLSENINFSVCFLKPFFFFKFSVNTNYRTTIFFFFKKLLHDNWLVSTDIIWESAPWPLGDAVLRTAIQTKSCVKWKFFWFPRLVIWHPDSEQKDGPLTRLGGRKEGAVIQRAGASRSETLYAKNSPVAPAAEKIWVPARLQLTVRLTQMISKRQVSLSACEWVTFRSALWGEEDEEFQQQCPSQP